MHMQEGLDFLDHESYHFILNWCQGHKTFEQQNFYGPDAPHNSQRIVSSADDQTSKTVLRFTA